jgi:mono/diheme cytochrome c family protein
MFRSWISAWVAAVVLTTAGCQSGPHSAAGFRLPTSGDAERGKTAFVAHQCYNCHAVDGVNLPPAALMAKAVALGGELPRQITDGYLVTSIINPSHVVAGYARSDAAVPGSTARMPDFADDLTVRELTDIVAFLQTRYSVQRAPRYPASL